MRKIAFILSLLFLAYSLSMCKNVFSAFSEPVTENYYQIFLPKTGQTTCYEPTCTTPPCPTVPCAGTGQDGEYQRGASWPSPRFIDNENGTVTVRLTGLMWQQNGSASGTLNWQDALNYVKTLTTGGYTDWRIPNSNELKSLVNYGLSDSAAWLNSQGFNGIQLNIYWSASTVASVTAGAWYVIMNNGREFYSGKINTSYVLAVRGGQ